MDGGQGQDEGEYLCVSGWRLTRQSRYALVDCEPTKSRRSLGEKTPAPKRLARIRLRQVFDGSVAWESFLFRFSGSG